MEIRNTTDSTLEQFRANRYWENLLAVTPGLPKEKDYEFAKNFAKQMKAGNSYGIMLYTHTAVPFQVFIARVARVDGSRIPTFGYRGEDEICVRLDAPNGAEWRFLDTRKRLAMLKNQSKTLHSYHFPGDRALLDMLGVTSDFLTGIFEMDEWWRWKEELVRTDSGVLERARKFLIERELEQQLFSADSWSVFVPIGQKTILVHYDGLGSMPLDKAMAFMNVRTHKIVEIENMLESKWLMKDICNAIGALIHKDVRCMHATFCY